MERKTTWLHAPATGRPATIIGEVAQAHDGSLGLAHAFIDAIATAGADAVKFQTHIASAESTPREPWRTRFGSQDPTRYDYWKRMEFTPEQWEELRRHAEERGLLFLSSPFSLEAFELLRRVGVAGWKVASGEITNTALLDAMAATRQPVMISTGMSALGEVDAAVARARAHDSPVCVMQCASLYPSPPEAVGLNMIGEFRERYGGAVGLSDHSGTIFPGLAAATLGIELLEVHVALSREMFGADTASSVTTSELAHLVTGVRFVERMRRHPVDKSAVAADVAPLREIFMKSVVAQRDLPAGTVLGPEHLTAKKPGTGIPVSEIANLYGRRLRRRVKGDAALALDDLEPV